MTQRSPVRHSGKLPRSVYLRRRALLAAAGLLIVFLVAVSVTKLFSTPTDTNVDAAAPSKKSDPTVVDAALSSTSSPSTTVEVAAPALAPTRQQGSEATSAKSSLVKVQTLGGKNMSPKSVVASGHGLVFAQNMMYHHTISVFGSDGSLVKTIPDGVELATFGIEGHPGPTKGAPVEAAFSPDGRTAWVSNYSMYGKGFGPEGKDKCSPGDGTSKSFLYRIDVAKLEVVAVVPVGAVPKYVAVTPDGSKVLVTNWCTWDLSVIDAKTNAVITTVPLKGRYPRGIAVSGDSSTAYIALMGSDRIVAVDLVSHEAKTFAAPGAGPRHIVISPDSSTLYVSNNRAGTVVRVSVADGRVTGSLKTGSQPRSMAISTDGEAIYVVNYDSATMTKVRTSDMAELQTVQTDHHPIGVTYEPTLKRVWVANYGGRVMVFDDARTAGP